MAIHTSGCCSIFDACAPTLALSILAVTTSSKSSALSIPDAAKLSTSFGCPSFEFESSNESRPPPADIAPGPADLEFGAFFLGLVRGFIDDSSSARSRAFSAFRARSALRFASAASFLAFPPFPLLSSHEAASLLSYWFKNRQ